MLTLIFLGHDSKEKTFSYLVVKGHKIVEENSAIEKNKMLLDLLHADTVYATKETVWALPAFILENIEVVATEKPFTSFAKHLRTIPILKDL